MISSELGQAHQRTTAMNLHLFCAAGGLPIQAAFYACFRGALHSFRIQTLVCWTQEGREKRCMIQFAVGWDTSEQNGQHHLHLSALPLERNTLLYYSHFYTAPTF